MPGPIPRPPNMRDYMYQHNWRIGYACAAMTAIVLPLGAWWVLYKRNRYDRYFEKTRDPAHKEFIRNYTSLEPQKYAALVKRLQGEVAEIKAKYEN